MIPSVFEVTNSVIQHLLQMRAMSFTCMGEEREVFVGRKPLHAYIAAIASLIKEGHHSFRIIGRGRSLERVADVAQVCLHRSGKIASTLPPMVLGQVEIDTEVLPREDGGTSRVSVLRVEILCEDADGLVDADE